MARSSSPGGSYATSWPMPTPTPTPGPRAHPFAFAVLASLDRGRGESHGESMCRCALCGRPTRSIFYREHTSQGAVYSEVARVHRVRFRGARVSGTALQLTRVLRCCRLECSSGGERAFADPSLTDAVIPSSRHMRQGDFRGGKYIKQQIIIIIGSPPRNTTYRTPSAL